MLSEVHDRGLKKDMKIFQCEQSEIVLYITVQSTNCNISLHENNLVTIYSQQ